MKAHFHGCGKSRRARFLTEALPSERGRLARVIQELCGYRRDRLVAGAIAIRQIAKLARGSWWSLNSRANGSAQELAGGPPALRWLKLVMAAVWLVAGLTTGSASHAAETNSADILSSLRPQHPRLLITSQDLVTVRAVSVTNALTADILAQAEASARALLSQPLLTYRKDGRRLLAVSREALRRVMLSSFAWRLTGEKAFAERAQREMLNLAAFVDWNPSHFLDTAEMTAALAIGYDWLFEELPVTARATIREAIVAKGLNAALDPKAKWNGWQRTENNWNQVCFGGLTLGALAIAEDESVAARELLERARTNNVIGLRPYAPEGIYPEGPGYWSYGTTYQLLMLSALESALDTDWNLSARPGFLPSAAALVQLTGPSGRPFNFADGGDGIAFRTALFWFADKLRQPELVYFQQRMLEQRLREKGERVPEDYLLPLLAKWTASLPSKVPPPSLPLAWQGDGPNPVGVFRSSWTDSNALFLAFKGGSANLNHGHMDAGSFVLEADGVRWAWDLGMQDYLSIESHGWSLFKRAQDSDRWRVYRLNNFSHNTLTLGGQLHNMIGDARITAFTTNSATVNLSEIFADQAEQVTRRFAVGSNRSVRVCDEIAGAEPGLSVRWQMVTKADIQIKKGGAVLRQDGQVLAAKIVSPAGAEFEIASAQPPDDGVNQRNPNARLLALEVIVPDSGKLTLEIQLQPGARASDQ